MKTFFSKDYIYSSIENKKVCYLSLVTGILVIVFTTIYVLIWKIEQNSFTIERIKTVDLLNKNITSVYRYNQLLKISISLIVSSLIAFLVKVSIDLKMYNRRLKEMAFFDPLTNLPNRRLMIDRLQEIIINAEKNNSLLCVCCLDIDNLKPVNDKFGHQNGDLLLVEMAECFKACIRQNDLVSRLGGDEFVILLQDLNSLEECKFILDKILECSSKPILLDKDYVKVTVSIGVSICNKNNRNPQDLLKQADQAMYSAKKTNKGSYQIFEYINDGIF